MDTVAMWVGYAVMAAGAMAGAGFAVGALCNYAWRKMLKDAPSMHYFSQAVAAYRKTNPPNAWVRHAMDEKPWRDGKA